MIAVADIRRVQEWMGHADIQTTMKYLHYAPHEEDARLRAEAFSLPSTADPHEVGLAGDLRRHRFVDIATSGIRQSPSD